MRAVRMFALVALLSFVMGKELYAKARNGNVSRPVLVNTCLITDRFSELVGFYERVLGVPPSVKLGEYAEFRTGAGVLAIFSAKAQEKYIPGSSEAASNKSAILQFRVSNVDKEFGRLQDIVKVWVKRPTNQPWGTRSFYFRDPDGNLVDFYALLKGQ